MAAVEPLTSTDSSNGAGWLVVHGTLREADFVSLLERTVASGLGDVTLDLISLDTLTAGGCWAIRNLADELWHRGRLLTVVFSETGSVAALLRSTGTVGHRHLAFQVSPVD